MKKLWHGEHVAYQIGMETGSEELHHHQQTCNVFFRLVRHCSSHPFIIAWDCLCPIPPPAISTDVIYRIFWYPIYMSLNQWRILIVFASMSILAMSSFISELHWTHGKWIYKTTKSPQELSFPNGGFHLQTGKAPFHGCLFGIFSKLGAITPLKLLDSREFWRDLCKWCHWNWYNILSCFTCLCFLKSSLNN